MEGLEPRNGIGYDIADNGSEHSMSLRNGSGYGVVGSYGTRHMRSLTAGSLDPGALRDDLRESSCLLIKPSKVGSASIMSCSINLCNTILGAGILGLPHAFAECGIVLGLSLFAFAGILSATGLHLLSACARAVPDGSFNVMADLTVPTLKVLADLAVALKCFGVGTSYLIVIGDVMPDACRTLFCSDDNPHCALDFPLSLLTDRRLWILVFSVTCVAGLVCFKKLDALRATSALSLMMMVYVCCMIVAYAWIPQLDPCAGMGDDCKGDIYITPPHNPFAILKVIPIFIFGYTCHQNTFTLVNELKRPTQSRCDTFIILAVSTCCLFYFVVAFSGYHTYGSNVAKDIIAAYPNTKFLAVGRIGLAFNMAFSYPLQCHPCRNSVSVLVTGEPAQYLDDRVFYTITFCILVLSVGISMAVHDLGLVLGLVGATGSTTISYILPGLFYTQYFEEWHFMKGMAYAMVVMGAIMMPVMVTLCFMGGGE
jgi:amino acid permease